MKVREEKLRTIIEWSEKNEDVRVLLLTSSLVNPLALVDEFSDLDIEFVFEDNTNYISDKSWTLKFGNPIAMIEEDESCFNHKHAMKMLLYEDGVKVDFKLYSKSKFIKETQEKELPEDWDIGYKILIDKDGNLLYSLYGSNEGNHSTKYNPCYYGDFLGDWREEVIMGSSDHSAIYIFSTNYPTEHRFPHLMTDHTYDMSQAMQNIGYNQPTHLGYYIGSK